jgi:lipid-binding SYLF domain-containing protein
MGSARFGSGLVVARLADGTWSAPSAVGTGGLGFGGQVGLEFTDFVVVLNSAAAVGNFSQLGSLMLGGNLSFTIGPMGRTVEANGAASVKGVAGFYSYSKTRGFFGGASLEGTVLLERRDANEQLYQRRVTAHELLSGTIPVPSEAGSLMNILNSPAFSPQLPPEVSAEAPTEAPATVSAEGSSEVPSTAHRQHSEEPEEPVQAPVEAHTEAPAVVTGNGPLEGYPAIRNGQPSQAQTEVYPDGPSQVPTQDLAESPAKLSPQASDAMPRGTTAGASAKAPIQAPA